MFAVEKMFSIEQFAIEQNRNFSRVLLLESKNKSMNLNKVRKMVLG